MVLYLYLLHDFHLFVGDEDSITTVADYEMGVIVSEPPPLTAPFQVMLLLHSGHVMPKNRIFPPCQEIQHVSPGEVHRTLQEILVIKFLRLVDLFGGQ
jgi:hypothetical protein